MNGHRLDAILLYSTDGVIGYDGELAFSIESDLKNFKDKTQGYILLMGYKTAAEVFKLNPNGLVGRQIAVLTDRPVDTEESWHEKVLFVDSVDELYPLGKVMVAGGATLYDTLAPYVDYWYVTQVCASFTGLYPDHDPKKVVRISKDTMEIIKSKRGVVRSLMLHDRISDSILPVRYLTTFKS